MTFNQLFIYWMYLYKVSSPNVPKILEKVQIEATKYFYRNYF